MLTVDQVVTHAMTKAGQVYFEASDLEYDIDRTERDIFIPALGEYQRYRPLVRKLYGVEVRGGVLNLPPDTIKVSFVAPCIDNYSPLAYTMGIQKAPLRRDMWYFQDGNLYVPDGKYNINCLTEYHTTKSVFLGSDNGLFEPFSVLKFPSLPVENSLVLPDGYSVVTNEEGKFIYNNNVKLAELSNSKIVFLERVSNFSISYTSRCLVVEELDMFSDLFLELFSIRFLIALSSTKAVLKISDLPVDVSLDDLMSYARTLEESYRSKLDTIQLWWQW